jgi:ferrochelatase
VRAWGPPYHPQLPQTPPPGPAGPALGDNWSFSYQSESPTGEPWLGPDILDHLRDLHARGVRRVLVCPVGFVSDHLEIRWDLDVEAVELAHELGLELTRIEMPNDEPAFVRTLVVIVRRTLGVPSPA